MITKAHFAAKFSAQEFIQESISRFESEHNLHKMWKSPLVSLLPADHPLLPGLRKTVTEDHLLPDEILPGAKTVIVFFVPFEERIIESNLSGEGASEEWAMAYVFTNQLLGYINDEFEKSLSDIGFHTAKINATHNFSESTLLSRWSHRHLAWIAGLGTFGINNMLITSNGCCGRFGSFVTDADYSDLGIPLSESPNQNENCLNKRNGSCGLCHKKCFAGAYKYDYFDRHKCYQECLKNAAVYKSIGLADVCGKCLVGLPCSQRIP